MNEEMLTYSAGPIDQKIIMILNSDNKFRPAELWFLFKIMSRLDFWLACRRYNFFLKFQNVLGNLTKSCNIVYWVSSALRFFRYPIILIFGSILLILPHRLISILCYPPSKKIIPSQESDRNIIPIGIILMSKIKWR